MKTKVVVPAKGSKRTTAGRKGAPPAKVRNRKKAAEHRDDPRTDAQVNASPPVNLYAEILKIVVPITRHDDAEGAHTAYRALFPRSTHISTEQLWHAAGVINLVMYALMAGPPPEPNDRHWQAHQKEIAKRLRDMANIARGGKPAILFQILEMADGLLRLDSSSPQVQRSVAENIAVVLKRIDVCFGSLSAEDLLQALSLARAKRWKGARLAAELARRARFPGTPSADAFTQAKRRVIKRMGWREQISNPRGGA